MSKIVEKDNDSNELLRLTVSIAIIAATVGIFSIDDQKYIFVLVLQGATVLPSLFFGLYLVFTGTHLKYKNKGQMGDLLVPEKLRMSCYDIGVNLFWYMFVILVLVFFASIFGWGGDSADLFTFWPSFVVSFLFLLVIAVVPIFQSDEEYVSKVKKKRKKNLFRRRR